MRARVHVGLRDQCGGSLAVFRCADANLKSADVPIRVQPSGDDLAAIIRSEGHAAPCVSEDYTWPIRRHEKSYQRARNTMVSRILDPHDRILCPRRPNIIDGSLAFQYHYMDRLILRKNRHA